MGQYHVVVNLDKKQFIHPHQLGDGLKLMEFANSAGGVMTGLAILLAVSNGRGGGDLQSESEMIGSWGGDRIAIVGDYAEDKDLPAEFEASKIWERCHGADYGIEPQYRDITADVRRLIEADGIYSFGTGDGWITRTSRFNKS